MFCKTFFITGRLASDRAVGGGKRRLQIFRIFSGVRSLPVEQYSRLCLAGQVRTARAEIGRGKTDRPRKTDRLSMTEFFNLVKQKY